VTAAAGPAAVLRGLHHGRTPGDPLILPNAWDAASARLFADEGFPALATGSIAVSAALGFADGGHTPPAEMFAAVARIVRAVRDAGVPVSADIERGYGLPPRELAERLLDAGAAGCNLEDSDPATKLLDDPERQADFLAAVVQAADGELVVNARTDGFLRGVPDPVAYAVARGRRYVAAGADCVYPIFAPPETLPELAEGIGAPVNAHHREGGPGPRELGALGATRVTFGGDLHAWAQRAVRDRLRELCPPA
jgi:2-methylisocitrate lyase-like PEP mutase family enzyme